MKTLQKYIPLVRKRRTIVSVVSILITVITILISVSAIKALGPVAPEWAHPTASALKNLGTIPPTGQARLAFEDNLDCIKANYTPRGGSGPQLGCFENTAFGNIEVRNEMISFAGSEDIVIPLIPFGGHDVLLPWPETSAMLSLTPTNSEGVSVSLYKNILSTLVDNRNIVGQVISKQSTKPADMPLLDHKQKQLVANFNSLTFSDGGYWLVAESTAGSFVRINLATLAVTPFAPSFFNFGAGYNQSQIAVSADGHFVAIANSAAKSFKVYDLQDCSSLSVDHTICASHDYWDFIASKTPNFQHAVHVRFLNNGLLSFTEISPAGETSLELAPTGDIKSMMDYIALGDSYTAGEGAYYYREGSNPESNECHNSTKSYPALLANDLYNPVGANSAACGGASINDIIGSSGYRGQNGSGIEFINRPKDQIATFLQSFSTGYLPQSTFVSHYQPGAVTVSVGGNDIGFGDVLKLCVAPHVNPHVTAANACYSTYEDRLELAHLIDRQVPRFTSLFKRLQALSPASTIYAIGYPLIAVDTGSCALNVHLNTTELALSIEITKQLNNSIATAAKNAGVSYVDIEDALAGHRLCEVDSSLVAVNGVTAGRDGGVSTSFAGQSLKLDFLGSETFHPNAYGYQLVEQAILRRTNSLKLKPGAAVIKPKPPAADPASPLLKAPKSGRPVIKKQPGTVIKQKSIKKGSSLPVKVKGTNHGLRANAPYKVTIGRSGVTPIVKDTSSDANGDISTDILIPPTTPSGPYIIDITGEDQLKDTTSVTDIINVIHSETDFDGDSIPDIKDSCPTIYNSGIDADKDGIDDSCDGMIGAVPQTPPPTPTPAPAPVVTVPAVVTPQSNLIVPPLPSVPAVQPPTAQTIHQQDTAVPITTTPLPSSPSASVNPTPEVVISTMVEPAVSPQITLPTTVSSTVRLAPTTSSTNSTNPQVLGLSTAQPIQVKVPVKKADQKTTIGHASGSNVKPLYGFTLPQLTIKYLYLLLLFILLIIIREINRWRRERDSNPRYP